MYNKLFLSKKRSYQALILIQFAVFFVYIFYFDLYNAYFRLQCWFSHKNLL